MLANLFYFCGLFLLLFHFIIISNIQKFFYLKEFIDKFQKVTSKKPEKSDFSESDYGLYSLVLVNNLFTSTWFFMGLIGANWLVFLAYFIYNPVMSLVSNINKSKFVSIPIDLIRIVLTTLLIGLLVFNHFHLHINLTKFLLP